MYARDKLLLPEEEARNFARTHLIRNRFFFEAFRLRHNLSLKALYLLPKLLFLTVLVIGLAVKTNWWFFAPALLVLALWVNCRKWSPFWIPFLYWFKPYLKNSVVAQDDIDPSDWRSYFFFPYPHGRANISQMINACDEEVRIFGFPIIIRSILYSHVIYLSGFSILVYFAWK